MKAVKTRQHVKGRAIHAGGQFQVEFRIGMEVFVALNCQEHDAEQHRHPHEGNGAATVIFAQRVMSNRQGHAGTEQQRGIDRRQPERRHGRERLNDVGRRGCHASSHAGPDGLEVRPEQCIVQATQCGNRMRACPPQGGEKRAEEHHFGKNEPAHAPAVGQIDSMAVQAAFAFGNRVTEPLEQRAEPEKHAKGQRPGAPAGTIDPLTGAQNYKKQANSGHDRVP